MGMMTSSAKNMLKWHLDLVLYTDATTTFLCKATRSGERNGYRPAGGSTVGNTALALLPRVTNSTCGTWLRFGKTVKTGSFLTALLGTRHFLKKTYS